jgi:hypothetical protein
MSSTTRGRIAGGEGPPEELFIGFAIREELDSPVPDVQGAVGSNA